MDKQEIGKRLAALRKESGKTAMEVAAAVGISQSAVSMYESGERIPRDEVKIRLSKFYGVPVEFIFFAK